MVNIPSFTGFYTGVSKNGGTPIRMVKIMEIPIKMDDLGVPLFLETPIHARWLAAKPQVRWSFQPAMIVYWSVYAKALPRLNTQKKTWSLFKGDEVSSVSYLVFCWTFYKKRNLLNRVGYTPHKLS